MIVPAAHRRPIRRALSIAVRYEHLAERGAEWVLEGTHHDPPKIHKLLTEVYKWREPEDEITILCDYPPNEYILPTRDNIVKAMKNLVRGAEPGDEFIFHFSGHGGQVPNYDGTEKDGLDEVIYPFDVILDMDNQPSNYILDDDIHDILVDSLPGGARMIMIFDSCHSGTAADLDNDASDFCWSPLVTSPRTRLGNGPFVKQPKVLKKRGEEEYDGQQLSSPVLTSWNDYSRSAQSETQPYVTCWSACKDEQLTYEWIQGGLFVEIFTQTLRRNPHPTHRQLHASLIQQFNNLYSAYLKVQNGSSSDTESEPPTPPPYPQLSGNRRIPADMTFVF
ncbi:hypothetical protein QCA50_020253 [Cerrena zonata]|uniref:Peptidase C14 caspase domain-containing protein n=1 Tax=Cerrena zonata TaxID=2478898 RepID=A0AAW0F805_9APHY